MSRMEGLLKIPIPLDAIKKTKKHQDYQNAYNNYDYMNYAPIFLHIKLC